jgi:hypothetical protein
MILWTPQEGMTMKEAVADSNPKPRVKISAYEAAGLSLLASVRADRRSIAVEQIFPDKNISEAAAASRDKLLKNK